jgi:hypothetical protein
MVLDLVVCRLGNDLLETSWLFSEYGRLWMIFSESVLLTPGSSFSCAAVAVLMSTRSVLGTAAVLRGMTSGALGEAGIAGAVAVGEAVVVVVDAG